MVRGKEDDSMTNTEKIQLLKKEPPKPCCLADYYYELLESLGSMKYGYGDYMTTEPINCDEELKRTATADWDYAVRCSQCSSGKTTLHNTVALITDAKKVMCKESSTE